MRSRLLVRAIAIAVVATPLAVSATSNTACQIQASSLMDQYLWTPSGGDNDFFTSHTGSTPNLLWILDNSCSMHDLPHMPATTGCADSTLNGLGYVAPSCANPADPSTCAYAAPYPDYDPNAPSWGGQGGYYQAGVAYAASLRAWNAAGKPASDKLGTVAAVCAASADPVACGTCIDTHGYYRTSNHAVVADGNFLNLYPPKYFVARAVFKKVLQDPSLAKVRMGLLDFNGWVDKDLNPSCDLADTNSTSANFYSNRTSISTKVEKLSSLDFRTSTPLADTLLRAEEYYTDPGFFAAKTWSPNATFESASTWNKKSVCWACQFNAIAVVTDGQPSCDNMAVPADIASLSTATHPELACPNCGTDACSGLPNAMHKVAWWFYNNDMRRDWADTPQPQHVSVFTIGFATTVPILQKTADVSGGKYYMGSNATQLETAMKTITRDVATRALSFTSANLSTVQASSGQGVLVPKLVPQRDGPWKGRLYRFRFLSEFSLGRDLNHDGKQDAFFLVDARCPNVPPGDPAGVYAGGAPAGCAPIRAAVDADVAAANPPGSVVLGQYYQTRGFFSQKSCTGGAGAYCLAGTAVPAQPVWEANHELAALGPTHRHIFTAVDGGLAGSPDGRFGPSDVVEFDVANAARLQPYLGLSLKSPFCKLWVGAGGPNPLADCVKGLIEYIRGCAYGDTSDASCTPRSEILGDIFHSQPAIEEPPTPYGVLHTPFRNPQSIVTLGDDSLIHSKVSGHNAYQVYSEGYASGASRVEYVDPAGVKPCDRGRVVLVGANDGMLHAFEGGTTPRTTCVGSPNWTDGTGRELWAFIPPDLLPKLQLYGQPGITHQLYVDGSPWVRDVWVDGSDGNAPDYLRAPGEFHTVVVTGERRGGHHTFALDVSDATAAGYVPKLLWLFPQPCDARELQVGQSFNDIAPLPPPIGPIRYSDPGGVSATPGAPPWTEKWVVALPGGYDARQSVGQGFFLLDAYTGKVLWDFSRNVTATTNDLGDATSTGATAPVRGALLYSFAAAPTLTNWGNAATLSMTTSSPYFDTLIAGDTGGQMWVGRFPDPRPSTWSGARVLVPDTQPTWHAPIFEPAMVEVAPESSYLRAFFGTGNRANLRDRSGGACSVTNPMPCAQSGACGSVSLESTVTLGSSTLQSEVNVGGTGAVTPDPANGITAGTCGGCGGLAITTETEIKSCTQVSGTKTGEAEIHTQVQCTFDAASGAYVCCSGKVCPVTPGQTPATWYSNGGPTTLTCVNTGTIPPNKFYSVRVFSPAMPPFASPAAAQTFDATPLTDASLANADLGSPATATFATAESAGWYYPYGQVSERTASPATIGGTCAAWASLAPLASAPLSCGGSTGGTTGGGTGQAGVCPANAGVSCPCSHAQNFQTAYMYLRDPISGRGGCMSLGATVSAPDRQVSRQSMGSEPHPPPPPQAIAQVSSHGQVQSGIATTNGGQGSTGAAYDLYGEVESTSVTREGHDWRHAACGVASGTNICK